MRSRAAAVRGPVAVLAIAILTWPAYSMYPSMGLDPSWQAALHLAAAEHLRFGDDIVFTYGPLGYLVFPALYFEDTGRDAILFSLAAHLATTATIGWLGLRAAPVPIALALSLAVAIAAARMGIPEKLAVVVVVVGVQLVRRPHAPPLVTSAVIGLLAAASALLVLMKVNGGLTALAAGAIVVAGTRQWRSVAVFAAVFVSVLLLVWSSTHHPLSGLGSLFAASIDSVRGYSSTMGLEQPGREWEYALAAIAVFMVALAALHGRLTLPRTSTAATIALVGLAVLVMFKHGFVRHDEHATGFFATMPMLALAVASRRLWPRTAVVTLALVAALLASDFRLEPSWDPARSATAAVQHLTAIASAERRRSVVADARERLREGYALEPALVAAMTGRTVHIDPWEAAVAWAYPELIWRPLPTIQSYVAVTRALDQRNEAFLASERAPEHILRAVPQAIDGRHPLFESPLATIQLLCRYAEVRVASDWQLLQRVPDRCGPLVELSSVRVDLGDVVDVPKASSDGELILAQVSGLDTAYLQVRSIVYKAPDWIMDVRDGRRFRTVPVNAASPHVMRLAATVGYSPAFRGGPPIEAFSIRTDAPDVGRAELVITFFAMRLGPPAGR